MTEEEYDNFSVDTFADMMKAKLTKKRVEDDAGGWHNVYDCSAQRLSDLLRESVLKGDPVDVANFAMMLCMRGDRILPVAQPER